MPQTITLTLPDNVLQPVQRVAQATKQSVEELLVTALQAALPTLEGLPPGVMQHLVALESLDDQQFPLRLRKSYGTMGANSSLSVSTICLCLLM